VTYQQLARLGDFQVTAIVDFAHTASAREISKARANGDKAERKRWTEKIVLIGTPLRLTEGQNKKN
jgi:hypothetical protein